MQGLHEPQPRSCPWSWPVTCSPLFILSPNSVLLAAVSEPPDPPREVLSPAAQPADLCCPSAVARLPLAGGARTWLTVLEADGVSDSETAHWCLVLDTRAFQGAGLSAASCPLRGIQAQLVPHQAHHPTADGEDLVWEGTPIRPSALSHILPSSLCSSLCRSQLCPCLTSLQLL